MNERIRELAEKCFSYSRIVNPGEPQLVTHEEVEKFAKLIVRDCAKTIESQDVDPSFKNRMSWAIKTKFGVE